MTGGMAEASEAAAMLDRAGTEVEVEDTFEGPRLDADLWIAAYLPQWSSTEAAAARYRVGPGGLELRIEADQPPWCPEFDGPLRVSSLQTGVFSGPLGSPIGQHRFRDDLVVREPQVARALYTPRYGIIEVRARALDDPASMVALWMIGFEDEPERSAEICVFEILGRDVGPDRALVGMGLHPFGDPVIEDDFERLPLAIDARQPHDYAVVWTPDAVRFHVDGRLVKASRQSPDYPMQLMLNIYEFAGEGWPVSPAGAYPKIFRVEHVRGSRPLHGPSARRARAHVVGDVPR